MLHSYGLPFLLLKDSINELTSVPDLSKPIRHPGGEASTGYARIDQISGTFQPSDAAVFGRGVLLRNPSILFKSLSFAILSFFKRSLNFVSHFRCFCIVSIPVIFSRPVALCRLFEVL